MLRTLMGSCRATYACAVPISSSSPSSSSFFSRTPVLLLQRWRWSLSLPPFPEAASRHPARLYRDCNWVQPLSFHCIPRAGFFSFAAKTSSWSADQSPYDVLGVEWNVDEEGIKAAYRRMVKLYHPDVYDESVELGEGETPETRFIKIQAAYELLVDKEERQQYDHDNRINPLKASKAWMEWIVKKKKAFEQRGDMAVSAWAEQQQRELSLKARRLAKYKMDPEEERRILTREKQASAVNFESTLRRHTLVLKKRDIMRRKMNEEAQKKLVQSLLAAEGLELAEESDDD
eukprot:c10807_g1_i1 orf=197-1063(-)